jgi:hypothetical protein
MPEINLDSMSMVFDGREMPISEGDVSMERKSRERIELKDTYHEVAGERPLKLERSFVALGASNSSEESSPQGEESKEVEETSELEGESVTFTWDEEEEEYSVAFTDDKGDEELLDELEEDADLRGFLPGKEVADGDTWEVGPAAFSRVVSPGGNVKLVGDEEGAEDEEIERQFEENLAGELTATWRGEREVGGRKVGVIALAGELASEAEQDVQDGPGEGTTTMALTYDVEGELLWDLEGGHFASLDLSGAIDLKATTEVSIGGEHEMKHTMALSGTWVISATAAMDD